MQITTGIERRVNAEDQRMQLREIGSCLSASRELLSLNPAVVSGIARSELTRVLMRSSDRISATGRVPGRVESGGLLAVGAILVGYGISCRPGSEGILRLILPCEGSICSLISEPEIAVLLEQRHEEVVLVRVMSRGYEAALSLAIVIGSNEDSSTLSHVVATLRRSSLISSVIRRLSVRAEAVG
ncbi:hypothetical protein PFISCL1PPCAC_26779, partial [Pristionchus fissidentatus]